MASVTFRNVSKRYGSVTALAELDLHVEDGEFVSLLGPSGSGKSTTLNLLAGLMDADAGEILIGDRPVGNLPPEARDIAMVFQNYALYPHLTLFENIAFPLQARRPVPPAAEIRARVERVAGMLGIADLLARMPREISGGQQQRVALGRAMVRDPKVFLLDEPLSNLDARLRIRMRRDLKALHRTLGCTMVYVTHDQAEAMTLSSRIAVFNAGRLQQFAPPAEIYGRPANMFVANFVGEREMNFCAGRVIEADGGFVFQTAFGRIAIAGPIGGPAEYKNVILGARPEAIAVGPVADASGVTAEIVLTELAGPDLYLTVRTTDGTEFVARADPYLARSATGALVSLTFDPARQHFFDAASGTAVQHGSS